MGSITQAQATLLSRPNRIKGLHEDTPTVDEFYDLMPWAEIQGHQVNIIRVSSANYGTGAWIDAGGATTDSSAVPTEPAFTFPLKRVYADLLLDSFSEAIYSNPDDTMVAEAELNAELQKLRYKIGAALVAGSTAAVPSEPAGLVNLVVAGQTVGAANDAANGGAMLITDVDRLLNKIKTKNGRADLLVMNLSVFQKWKNLFYTNGTTPRVAIDLATGAELFYHGNVRVAISDWIPNNEVKGAGANLSSMYAVSLGWGVGFCGAFKSTGGSGKMHEIERLMIAATDQHRYRVSANLTFALFSESAIARMSGIA